MKDPKKKTVGEKKAVKNVLGKKTVEDAGLGVPFKREKEIILELKEKQPERVKRAESRETSHRILPKWEKRKNQIANFKSVGWAKRRKTTGKCPSE